MKTYQLFVFISSIMLLPFSLLGQGSATTYKHSVITLPTGETIKAKNITVSEEDVTFKQYNSATGVKEQVSYSLSEIQDVKVAIKTNKMKGLLRCIEAGIY